MANDPQVEPIRRRRRRVVRTLGICMVVVVLFLLVGSLLAALSVRRALLSAREDLLKARSALVAGDAAGAEPSFVSAAESFRSVSKGPVGLFLGTTAWVPGLGHTAKTTLAISDAGATAADAGRILAAAVVDTPGGLAALSPSGGGFSIERLAPLEHAAAQADGLLTQALATVQRSPGSFLVGPVASARTRVVEELGSLKAQVHSGSSILTGLPNFMGQEGPRSYLLAAQDPAELRGTGGLIGAYTILTIDNGRFSFGRFRPTQSLPIPPLDQVPPPSAEYARNYNQFRGGERFWLAINLTPDFPTAAQAILNAYQVAEGTSLDGVIFADPFALKALLRIEGTTKIPRLGTHVSAASVVSLTTNRAFTLFHDPTVRKRVLGTVATAVVKGFIAGPPVSLQDLKIVGASVGEGHLLVYSTDPVMEEGLRGTGAGGALPASSGDLLSVVENSAGANKVDYYQDRAVSYSVALGDGGTATATTEIRLTNNAPTTGEPTYVIGPHKGSSRVGESSQLLNVYGGPSSELLSASRDGVPVTLGTGVELGHPFFQDFFRTPSGQTSDLKINSYLPAAWQMQGAGGTYHLTYLGQTTVRPATLRVEVVVPPGAHITSTSPSMQIDGTTAVWSGIPKHRMSFSVEFGG